MPVTPSADTAPPKDPHQPRSLPASGPAARPAPGLAARITAIALLSTSVSAPLLAAPTPEPPLEPSALAQIEKLMADKAARSPAERKISSHLLYAAQDRRGEVEALGLPTLRNQVEVYADGTTLVDLRARISERLLARIDLLGGSVVNHHPRFDTIRAYVPLLRLEILAGDADVDSIQPAMPYLVQGNTTVTEGDAAHRADLARAQFGVDGSGVSVCAMSDSVEELGDLQAAGELPPGVTVLPGQAGTGTSEGTALLEIIHDIAPGAQLFFATGLGGPAQMAQNILDLAAAGCDVIVDDVLYLGEAVFQDDIIAQAVEQVAAQGVLYFSSAGNSGNLASGESGVWEGVYSPTTLPTPVAGQSAHDFGGGNNGNQITEDAQNDAPLFTLQWNDPVGASDNDYDFFLLDDSLSNVIAASTNTQDGNDFPIEFLVSGGVDDTGNRLVVALQNGAARFLHVNTHRGRLEIGTDGQIFGHPAAASAIAVAAVQVPAGGGAFTGNESVEPFSSDGPRRIFFEANGTPARDAEGPTKGGGDNVPPVTRQKPDITAADGVSTASSNFPTFFGTSASAPHSAGISALLRQLDSASSQSAAQLRDLFASSSLDIEDPGFDDISGLGIIDGVSLLEETGPIFADGFESGNTSSWTK